MCGMRGWKNRCVLTTHSRPSRGAAPAGASTVSCATVATCAVGRQAGYRALVAERALTGLMGSAGSYKTFTAGRA